MTVGTAMDDLAVPAQHPPRYIQGLKGTRKLIDFNA